MNNLYPKVLCSTGEFLYLYASCTFLIIITKNLTRINFKKEGFISVHSLGGDRLLCKGRHYGIYCDKHRTGTPHVTIVQEAETTQEVD